MCILNKKNMKTLKYIISFVMSCFIISSCSDDWLQLTPVSNMNEGDFYKTEKDFLTAVTAAYATLSTEFGPQSGPSYCGEQMSDEALIYNATGQVADKVAFMNYNLQPANSVVQSIYRNTYTNLHIINTVIAKLRNATFEESKKAAIEGEMCFLRGLYYFNLVREFGDVPLIKRPITTVAESYNELRVPVTEIYKSIISDFRFAADNLPLRSQISRTGQITKGAAQSMLGKVYLTLNQKDSAAYFLREVINSNQYQLVANYANLWGIANKNTTESIFEIQFIGAANSPTSPYMENFAPYENFTISGQGQGMNQVSEHLWNEYEPNDPRKEISVFEGYTNRSGVWIDVKFQAKWYDDVYLRTSQNYYGNNFKIIRLADVYLMYAEATGSAEYLNKVRERVGLPLYGTSGYPSDLYPTFALAIEHERYVELALEFHRWFDLKRTNRATTVLTERKGKAITEDMLVLPIPLAEIDINPKLTQNSYYVR